MNFKTIITIFRKELVETLRDKRTLIAMIGIPMVLYPVLIIIMGQVTIVLQEKVEEKESRICLISSEAKSPADPCRITPRPLVEWISAIEKVRLVDSADPNADLLAGKLDAVVSVPLTFVSMLDRNGSIAVGIQYDGTEDDSRKALSRVRKGLQDQSNKLLEIRLSDRGLDRDFARPLQIQEHDVAPPKKTTGSLLGRILPMIMIVMLGVGAFYPAVDLTAGEKERGTFETLLSTPTSKLEIVYGKFLAVFCLAVFTALLNLASMAASMVFLVSQISSKVAEKGGQLQISLEHLSFLNITLILLILIPLAFFICSVMMSIALFARSYKEAQNYVSPFYIMIILPSIIAGMPGIELSETTMFFPIANVVLLFKNMLIGKFTVETFFGVFFSTAIYALLALQVAVWLFQREEVILSEEKGFPLSLRRSVFQPRKYPTAGLALALFALMILMLFYGGSYVQRREIISGLLITEWLFLFVPTLLILWYVRVSWRSSLSIEKPSFSQLALTILMALGMLVIVLQITIWQNHLLPQPKGYLEEMEKLFSADDGGSSAFLKIWLAVALSPAICEEVLFRGAILSGLRTRLSNFASVLVVGILFGLFHLSLYRILPTAIMGMAITYMVLRGGSLFLGILFHLIVNTSVILIQTGRIPVDLKNFLESTSFETNGFPFWVLLPVLFLVSGIVLVQERSRRRVNQEGIIPK